MATPPHNRTDADRFEAYFAVADEIYEPQFGGTLQLTLDDIDADYRRNALKAAESLGLAWPPYLPEAEEYALTYRTQLAALRAGR